MAGRLFGIVTVCIDVPDHERALAIFQALCATANLTASPNPFWDAHTEIGAQSMVTAKMRLSATTGDDAIAEIDRICTLVADVPDDHDPSRDRGRTLYRFGGDGVGYSRVVAATYQAIRIERVFWLNLSFQSSGDFQVLCRADFT